MRVEKCRVGQIHLNKANNKIYQVSETGEDFASLIEVVQDETGEYIPADKADVINVTTDNDICFRFVYDPNPPILPETEDFSVTQNVLYYKGVPVVMGEINANLGIEVINGKYYFIGSNVGGNFLFSYNPKRDRFLTEEALGSDYTVDEICGRNVIINNAVREEVVKNEDDTETKTRLLDWSNVLVFDRNGVINVPVNISYITPTDIKITDKYIYIGCDNVCPQWGDDSNVITETGYRYYVYSKDMRAVSDVVETGAEAVIVETPLYDTLFYTPDEIIVGARRRKVYNFETAKLASFVYLVDVTRNGDEEVLTFANEQGNAVKKVSYKETHDRGVVCTIN